MSCSTLSSTMRLNISGTTYTTLGNFFCFSSITKRDFIFSQCFTMSKSTLLLSNKNAIKAKLCCAQTDKRGQQDYHKLPRIHVSPSFSTLHKRGEGCFLEHSISLVHTPPWFLMMLHARSTIIPWLFEYVLWEISGTCVYSKLENLHCQC